MKKHVKDRKSMRQRKVRDILNNKIIFKFDIIKIIFSKYTIILTEKRNNLKADYYGIWSKFAYKLNINVLVIVIFFL